MAGQIIKRGDRTYLVRIFTGRDPETGKRTFHNKTIKGTKKDAERYRTKKLREMHTGTYVDDTDQTVAQYLEEWLRTAVKPRVRSRTLYGYQRIVEKQLGPALGSYRLHELTPAIIQRLYTDMTERGLAPRTVRYAHAVLRNALGQAVKWRTLAVNPADAVTVPKQQRREMRAFSAPQAGAFLKAAESDDLHALWVVLLTTGMRPGEALALRWSDQDGDTVRVVRTLVRVPGKPARFEEPKTPRSRRAIPLTASCVRALATHRSRQAAARLAAGAEWADLDLIFPTATGEPTDTSAISRRFRAIVAGVEGLPTIRLYDLRHTCASLMLASGENPKVVAERLGHATITLTLDTYSHVLPGMQRDATDRLERLLAGA